MPTDASQVILLYCFEAESTELLSTHEGKRKSILTIYLQLLEAIQLGFLQSPDNVTKVPY
jgi:hypothetical protein